MTLENAVKLVIWDLDDTLWEGTLSETSVIPISRNVAAVKTLAERGIISSVCSKNDYDVATAKLKEFGIGEYFVFPAIDFEPKGKAVSQIIENAALRSQNVLFVDDNPANLDEVRFFNPDIMTAHPDDIGELLSSQHLLGKPDAKLTRLKQYQRLQLKAEERKNSNLSNEEFLRFSKIRVDFEYDITGNFERVVELINRTNQLNFTKVRLNTPEELDEFKALLGSFGIHAGCVRATDKYGDYGLVGFFMLRRSASGSQLLHFVFSCRTMHMGIEQYVYEKLGRPAITVSPPVAYGLSSNSAVDWINRRDGASGKKEEISFGSLVLLGGCDLMQLAFYCSSNRLEFVNKIQDGVKVRYEDPGFILSDRSAIARCTAIKKIPSWTLEDALRFDDGIANADLILISMWPAMHGVNARTRADVMLHFQKKTYRQLQQRLGEWFEHELELLPNGLQKRVELLTASLDAIGCRSRSQARVFVLGCSLEGQTDQGLRTKAAYNEVTHAYCDAHGEKFHFVDFAKLVPASCQLGKGHLSREGYHRIAGHILKQIN